MLCLYFQVSAGINLSVQWFGAASSKDSAVFSQQLYDALYVTRRGLSYFIDFSYYPVGRLFTQANRSRSAGCATGGNDANCTSDRYESCLLDVLCGGVRMKHVFTPLICTFMC